MALIIFVKLLESRTENRLRDFPLSIQRVKSFESFASVSAGVLVLIISIAVGMVGGSVRGTTSAAAADAIVHVVIVDVASIVVVIIINVVV